jgi:hypothetical protein
LTSPNRWGRYRRYNDWNAIPPDSRRMRRRGDQTICGTPLDPLRAAAFRP